MIRKMIVRENNYEEETDTEQEIYNQRVKPFLSRNDIPCVFLRNNLSNQESRAGNVVGNLQLRDDIDLVIDIGGINHGLSLKCVRGIFDQIVVNIWNNREEERRGWLYTSQADFHLYVMAGFKLTKFIIFNIDEIRKLNLDNYDRVERQIKVGGVEKGHSVAVKIPLQHFKHKVVNDAYIPNGISEIFNIPKGDLYETQRAFY